MKVKFHYGYPLNIDIDTNIEGVPDYYDLYIQTLCTHNIIANSNFSRMATFDGGGTISERGVCWNTTGSPTTADNKITAGVGEGEYNCKLVGLTPGSTIYIKAYGINPTGTGYGYEVSFTTPASSIVHSSSGKIIIGTGKVIVID